MSQELPTQSPKRPQNKVVPLLKTERELAWQVAPSLFTSFKYAWMGISYAFVTQRNFRIHVGVGMLAIALGILLKASAVELAVLGVTSGLVMALELLNTAIESVVDLTVKQSYHELAKVAKDCAAAAVLMSGVAAVFVAACILLPKALVLISVIFG